MAVMTPEQWETELWTPGRPLATNDFSRGVFRQPRPKARGMRYVQHSPDALIRHLVIDVDHPDTVLKAFGGDHGLPPPSYVASAMSGHGHVDFALASPVCRTDNAKAGPLRLAALVQEGLRRGLEGDPDYRGQLTKNPLHEDWEVIWGTGEPWQLIDLAVHLGDLMPKALPKKRSLRTGLGRNVALFDALRGWAYPRRGSYTDATEWDEVAYAVALSINDEFDNPLPMTEVGHTSRSVARWTWRNIKMSLSQYQATVGRKGGMKGGLTRGEAKARRKIRPQQVRIHTTEQLALFTTEETLMPATYQERRIMTARQAAADLGVSARTIQRHVAEPREMFLARTRARAGLAAELRSQGFTWRQVGDRLGISAGAAKETVRRQKIKTTKVPNESDS